MNLQLYYNEQYSRIEKLFNNAKHSNFENKKGLADWYVGQLEEYGCKCYYCETSIHDINKLIEAKLLKTRAVRGNGKRGTVLEIDKSNNTYSKDTCVLACYYCNNDKSYTLDNEEYKKYFGKNRKKYFQILLKQLV